jgi:Patatin-like phospholipase
MNSNAIDGPEDIRSTQFGPDDAKALDFTDVLKEEMKVILGLELPERDASITDPDYEKLLFTAVEESGTDLTALCLSGGGIRSASFALGVMQTLARFGLLGQFHYLSSVSGGGYIASWLSLWRRLSPDKIVFEALNAAMHTGNEAAQITGIRADSNYLTPQLGLLSADTWTVFALYLRNLLLNWLLFAPFFMGCLMVPRLCVMLLASTGEIGRNESVFRAACLLGGILVALGLSFAVYGRFRKQDHWLTDGRFILTVLCPLVASGATFTFAAVLAGRFHFAPFAGQPTRDHLLWGLAAGALIYFIAWFIGRMSSRSLASPADRPIEKKDVAFWTLSGGVVGLIVSIGMAEIVSSMAGGVSTPEAVGPIGAVEVLGLSGFVVAYLAGELLYVGLASFSHKGDMDREWLARSSGWLSAAAISWTVVSAIAVFAPLLVHSDIPHKEWLKLNALLGTGGVSGFVTLLLGWSNKTAATQATQSAKGVPLMRIAGIAAVIFAVSIAALLALFDERLEIAVQGAVEIWRPLIEGALLIFLIGIAFLLSTVVNVNRFSLHALYRNRLVRAFLGSARAGLRAPDPFTGFDAADNQRLAEMRPQSNPDRLFHVINAALNIVASKNEAWQERKAESFAMTRLCCGNPYVRYRRTKYYGHPKKGISLGTAVAISGASVSPNQGYNSSPLIGFLLMLFNVRLGWWLGNPKMGSYALAGPTFSLTPALRELAGDTTDDSEWIYLSDGGHFENLGLYEMIRRRCRRIVVSDAGCDPTCSFEDLGNAVRKIYIDFGVSIDFEKLEIKARQHPPVPGIRFAIGSIKYPGSSREGWLLYLKPTYQATTERADIRSYASSSPEFPHESTTDQWFSESQLESYRALGASIAEYICNGGARMKPGARPDPMSLDALAEVATSLLESELSKLQTSGCCKPDSSCKSAPLP